MEVLLSYGGSALALLARQNKLHTMLDNTSQSVQLSAPATISVISCVMLA